MKLNRRDEQEEIMENDEELEDTEELAEDEDLYDDLTDEYYDDGQQPPMEKRADLLKSLTSFEVYKKNIFNNWLGLTWNEEEGKYVRNKNIEPIMNMKCAMWGIGVLETYARNNNVITDINYEQYRNIMLDHISNVVINIGVRDDFGIKEDGDLLRIYNELIHGADLALMMAGDGKSRDWLGTSVTRHENINPNQPMMQPMGGYGGYPMQPVAMIPQKTGMIGKIRKMITGR